MPRLACVCLTWLAIASTVEANLIVNSSFESGDFTGWTVADQPGGADGPGGGGTWYLQTGTFSPRANTPVPAPPAGTFAAMTDQGRPGSHVLYQEFVVPMGVVSATLSFQLFLKNTHDEFIHGPGLDALSGPNQQARVDLMTSTSTPFSTFGTDILLNLYQTRPGDTLLSGYSLITTDVTALFAGLGGQTVRLRFAEVDNQRAFQMGIDDARLDVSSSVTAVPEPGSLVLAVVGFVGVTGIACRKGRVADEKHFRQGE